MNRMDLTGQVFSRLTVINYAYSRNGRTYWHCRCECGNEKNIMGKELKNGNIRSCGCLALENPNRFQKKYEISSNRLYCIWRGIKQRCLHPSTDKQKKDYFNRGITVCDEWKNYNIFQTWALENGYAENLTIDRIDNNGNYCPANCRWVDIKTQANNKRNNHFITYNGKTLTLAQWARELGLKYNTLNERLRKGWSVEKAFTHPFGGKKCLQD